MCEDLSTRNRVCTEPISEHHLKMCDGVELFPSVVFLGRSYAVFKCHDPDLFSHDVLDMCPLIIDRLGVVGAIATDRSYSRAVCGRGVSEAVSSSLLKLLKET